MRVRILALLGLGLPLDECVAENVPEFSGGPLGDSSLQRCTVDDLLPGFGDNYQSRWVPLETNETRSREYDCTCQYARATYFCPHGQINYPSWIPRAVADGECARRDVLNEHPFPAGIQILIFGNSHLRQVVESIVCLYAEKMVTREYQDTRSKAFHSVPLDRQCRGGIASLSSTLLEAGCLTKEEVDSYVGCGDDRAIFHFANGATVHYWFAHHERDKTLDQAFETFGTSATDYDIVVANSGNDPELTTERVVRAAQRFHEERVVFLWLSTYTGVGNVEAWPSDDRNAFTAASGKYLAVHDIMKDVEEFTVGAVEHTDNGHFCLPGPPSELGVLVLHLVWALHGERTH